MEKYFGTQLQVAVFFYAIVVSFCEPFYCKMETNPENLGYMSFSLIT